MKRTADEAAASDAATGSLIAQFETADGERTGPQLDVPLETTAAQLQLILNQLQEQTTSLCRTPSTWAIMR